MMAIVAFTLSWSRGVYLFIVEERIIVCLRALAVVNHVLQGRFSLPKPAFFTISSFHFVTL